MKILISILVVAFGDIESILLDTDPLTRQMIAGEQQKVWVVNAASPEIECSSINDDEWIFFANGTFEFDHGKITSI